MTDPRPIHRIRLVGLLLLGLACTVLSMVANGQPHRGESQDIKDPHFGEALFYFYQQQYFSAITNLMTARHFERLPHHADEAELLLGGMYLSYGLHRQAGEIFQRLIDTGAPPAIRDRAWFYLAKIRYQRGYLAEAEAAMARIHGTLPGELEDERQLLQAYLLMQQQNYREAAEVLARMRGNSVWAAYGRYNLGVALIKVGDNENGVAFLERIGRESVNIEELRSLKDKANVALGYALLRDGVPSRAQSHLEQVRLNGLLSNKALLGVGWAHSAQNRHEASLIPWAELLKRNVVDPAVQESLLAVPYALTRLGAYKQSLEQYENAMAVFTNEMSRIDASVAAIRSGKMVEGILQHDPSNEMGWFWRMQKIPDAPESRYLLHLMAGHDFQEALKNYRDLRFLAYNLDHWQKNISIYTDMLATRRLGFEQRLPPVLNAERSRDFSRLPVERDRLAVELERIEKDDDVMALAHEKEYRLLLRLKKVERTLDASGGDGDMAAARDKHRLLRGLLVWDVSSDFPGRLWEAKKNLKNLERGIAETGTRREALVRAQQQAPQMFEEYGLRIARLRGRLSQLQNGVLTMSSLHGRYLEELAAAELTAQKERLSAYLTQVRFAVAQMYDEASNIRKEAE